MYKILHELDWAYVTQVSPNEVSIDQKHPDLLPKEGRDPCKLRFGSWTEDIFGWISGDRLVGDKEKPTRREKLGIKLGLDPGDRNVFSVSLQRPNTTDDANMNRVVEMYHDQIKFLVPVVGATITAPTPSRFRSDDGRYVYNVQGDPTADYPYGRIVQYDTKGTTDESKWTAVAILKPV